MLLYKLKVCFLKFFIKIERERVSEQVITHWFQNKRKINRKGTSDDSFSVKSPNDLNNSITNSTSANQNNNSSSGYTASSNFNFLNGNDSVLRINQQNTLHISKTNEEIEEDDEEEEDDENGVY